jgi:hypothetical protein
VLDRAARAGDIPALESTSDAGFDWMRALTEAVEAAQFATARWVFETRKPGPSYRYSASGLLVRAYCSGGLEFAREVRGWYVVSLEDLRGRRHQELLWLVRSHKMGPVRRWVEDFDIPPEDLHPRPRDALGMGVEALCIPINWLWELCVHCDRPTLAWLLARGMVSRGDLLPGHATLARSFNADERVAPWLEAGAPPLAECPAGTP